MIRKTMKVEGDSECWRALRVFSQKEVRAFVNARESDGTVLGENGFKGFFEMGLGNANGN